MTSFFFFTQFTIGQTFIGRPLCPNQSIYVSSATVTTSLEISLFTCNDLVLAAKRSKECPKLLLKSVKIFKTVFYSPNFYWPTLLSESYHMNCVFSPKITAALEILVFICNGLVFASESSKNCTLNHFWQVSTLFYSVYYRLNYYFYLGMCFFVLICISCVFSAR